MSVTFLILFAGFILMIAGLKNVSFLEAFRGNFDVPKTQAGG